MIASGWTALVKYALPAAWLVLFSYRLAFGGGQLSLWLLRILTVAILFMAGLAVWRFASARYAASRRGEQVLTKATVRGVLIATAVLGLLLRVIAWDPGNEGVVAWVGGIVLVVSVGGLIWLQLLREREAWRPTRDVFYFNPYWRYALLLGCVVTLCIQGVAKPEGIASSLNLAVFWLSLMALIGQSIGRVVLRRRGHGPGAPTGPTA
jgi:Ca2+/Na+ antiporter